MNINIIDETILTIINQIKTINKKTSAEQNLYNDLNFDSLSFINLIIKIEHEFHITFNIEEIASCVQIQRLLSLTKSKIMELNLND